jgi:predicted kinase
VASGSPVPLLVIVTGPPAAGKTTIARELAAQVGLPLLEKDAIKEQLYDTIGWSDREASRGIGAAAFALLFDLADRLLRAGMSFVLEANFAVEAAGEWFERLPPCRVVQVLVTAPDDVVLERYLARASTQERHPGHADIEALPEVEHSVATGRHAALAIPGRLLELDTSTHVDVAALVELVRGELQASYAP